MMRTTWLGAALLALSLAAPAAAQTDSLRAVPSRVELHAVPTLTLSDTQFLNGDRTGAREATVSGEFRIAQGSGRLPVAVLMHGSGGIGPNVEAWGRELNALGVSTFTLNSFTGRGMVSTSADQASLGRLNFILDLYRALDILAKHPRVDPERIVLIGFSRGGQAALYAAQARFHRLWNTSGANFAGYVAFYPDCATTYVDDTAVVPRPIRLFHGAADDYNPLRSCRAYLDRLRAAGRDVGLTEYAGAHHGFDNPISDRATVSATSQTVRDCTIREGERGVLINAGTNQPFTYRDACVALGPNVGGDPAANRQVRQDLPAYLRTLLRLGTR